ncbi:hypothetical protein [Wenyingzhuangia sp. IMCC45467]
MKKTFYLLLCCTNLLLLLNSCNKDAFMEDRTNSDYNAPSNLIYAEILNAREFSFIKTSTPIVNTNNLTPTFEILSGRTKDGTILDATYMKDVSIQNPNEITVNLSPTSYYVDEKGDSIKTYTALDTKNAGVITIADENKFDIGDYYFDIKVSTEIDGNTMSSTFTDAFHLSVGPLLVTNLLYSPIAQNIVVGTENTTTKPYLITGNSDVTFALTSQTDKLSINPQTGIISLLDGYSTVENDTIYPTVQVTSNISGEITSFQGDSFLMLVASNSPVSLPKKTNYFFYPTFESENKLYGYSKDIINQGDVADSKLWMPQNPSPLAATERPDDITNNKSLFLNPTEGNWSAHESDIIINSQDLTQYKLGYNLSSVFYIYNQYVEYMPDGSTPTDLEIYYSTDYNGDNATANWVQINDQISCQINSLSATPFIGTPYPGDQQLGAGDPDGRKDTSKNADAKWVRCEFDLNPYKDVKNFTLKFKVKSYYTGSAKDYGSARPGRYVISDVHFKATEE